MNEIVPSPVLHGTTQAADGFPRLKWTLAEFERLSDLGFFGGIDRGEERVELVDGDLVLLGQKPPIHERVRCALTSKLSRLLPEELSLVPALGWRPGGEQYFEPDIIVFAKTKDLTLVPPGDVLLLVEVADGDLSYDGGMKARTYAELGVREYWVVNAKTLETIVHLSPSAEGYASVSTVPPSETVTPHLLSALSVSLGGLGIA